MGKIGTQYNHDNYIVSRFSARFSARVGERLRLIPSHGCATSNLHRRMIVARRKEGKYAVKWTRLSCHDFRDNQVRLQLFALAYNLGNFLRRLALPQGVEHWSLTTLREKLVKIGAKVIRHARYVVFQMAEVAIPRRLFATILRRISRLCPAPF